MSFATVVNCMDGRVQEAVVSYMKERFGVEYVDVITQPGPNLVLSKGTEPIRAEQIFEMVGLSLDRHHSRGVAIAGHHDCIANPSKREEQESHIHEAMKALRRGFPDIEIIGLWVDEDWSVIELPLRV